MKHLRPLLLASALVLVAAASASALIRPACICPDNFAPVFCSNGHVYGNACVAACSGATGCVPDRGF